MKFSCNLLITTILFLSTQYLSAQNQKFEEGLLWKISGKELPNPSYILGSHHLISTNFADSINGLKQIIDETEQTVGEVVLSAEDQAAMQMTVMKAVMMPEDKNYNSLLSDEEYRKLDELLQKDMSVGLEQFARLKPSMISQLYVISIYKEFNPEYNPQVHQPIDLYLQEIAKEKGKAVYGLETIEDQINALYMDPLEQQASDLLCMITNRNYVTELLSSLNDHYKRGAIQLMYDLSFNNPNEPCEYTQEQKNKLNKDRNDKWLEKLPKIMKEKSSLIVVGALHLSGEEGLLSQLDKMGYTVEVVK